MPMLRPYSSHAKHLGNPTTKVYDYSQIFHFDKCKVASYIISELLENQQKLQYKNGKPTALYLHAVKCEDCSPQRRVNVPVTEIENIVLKIEQPIVKKFTDWIKKYHNSVSQSAGLQILIDWYIFSQPEIARLRRYEIKFGDIDRFKKQGSKNK